MTTPGTGAAPSPSRPSDAADAALFDATAGEHGVIYGYGLVSAHSAPENNELVSDALADHRDLREAAIARLTARNVPAPLPAPGYRMPIDVTNPSLATKLAIQMEEDSAVAWRAVAEQARSGEDRELAVNALTRSAVNAAKWRAVLGVLPSTVAFPGGTER